MSERRPPPKEFRASLPGTQRKLTYAEKLLNPKWQRKRLEILQRAEWRCQECQAEDRTLHVHHIYYPACCEPWDVPGELLLALCDFHHRERQAVEAVIFVEVAKHLARLSVPELRRQPIFAFFEDNDPTLDCLPAWQRDYLRWQREEHDES